RSSGRSDPRAALPFLPRTSGPLVGPVRGEIVNIEIPLLIVADLIAAVVLTFGLYWRRHYRRDLVVAFMGINVGVLSVSAVLADSEVGAGVGLGLFGVLSIIRLRSDELAQH